MPHFRSLGRLACAAGALALAAPAGARAQTQRPAPAPAPSDSGLTYTISLLTPALHVAHVRAVIPTDGEPTVDLFLPAWTPGYFGPANYPGRVDSVTAMGMDDVPLTVQRTGPTHWEVQTGGARAVTVTYRVHAGGTDPTGNWVGDSDAVLNGRATYLAPVGDVDRTAHVALILPPGWRSLTSLDTATDRLPNHYRAQSYAQLVDAPLVAGRLETVEFDVAGATHMMVDVGAPPDFSAEDAGRTLLRLVVEVQRFWGFLPYQRYEFYNVFQPGVGGPGHSDATILSGTPDLLSFPDRYGAWLTQAARGYLRAWIGTRMHPAEFTPPDYDLRPGSPSRWITAGIGAYYAELLLERAGLSRQQDFLDHMSGFIARVQSDPMRRTQTLTAAAQQAGQPDAPPKMLDWVAKGAVVGMLLDAHLRTVTNGAKDLDDVMRLAYQRYSGTVGYTSDQFRALVSQVAGSDQSAWLSSALDSTDSLSYSELLQWYGLRFEPNEGWRLGVIPMPTGPPPTPPATPPTPPVAPPSATKDTTTAPPTPLQQQQHLQELLKPDAGPGVGTGSG